MSKGLYSGNGWAVLVNRDYASTASHKINLYLNGVVAASIAAPAGGWQVGQWYHYAFTRSGAGIMGYLNGAALDHRQQRSGARCQCIPAAAGHERHRLPLAGWAR